MQGELVVVRAFGDEPLVRRVWETTQEAVFICSEENYQNLISGKAAMNAVGFPKEDVFRYDPTIAKDSLGDPSLWERLTLWDEVEDGGRRL